MVFADIRPPYLYVYGTDDSQSIGIAHNTAKYGKEDSAGLMPGKPKPSFILFQPGLTHFICVYITKAFSFKSSA